MIRLFTLLFFISIFSLNSYAQTEKELKKTEKQAYDYIANRKFSEATPLYKQLTKANPENEEYRFFLGVSYLGSANENDALTEFSSIISKFETSKEETAYTRPAYYYSGTAYHNLYLFDQAIESYKKLEQFELDKEGKKELDQAIKKSEDAKAIFMDFKPLIVTRLAVLNSPSDDHTPIPTADNMKIFFTSKREGGTGNGKLSPEGKQYEDIWIWDKNKGLMSKPYNIGAPINTADHEATCGLSVDGKTLFIYKSSDKYAGDIFVSHLIDTTWTTPEKLSKNINKKRTVERHAALSPDGKKLYFSTNRKKGKGGRDIWVSELQSDSTWGKATLVPVINTEKDEESPFLLPDGKTMYFSSKGFNGMGGYDIFKTVMDDNGVWSEPVNIGFPINTTGDDVFYFPLADEKTAYFTRRRGGKADIFKANLYGPQDEVIIISGLVKDNKSYTKIYGVESQSNDTIYYDNRYFLKSQPVTAINDSIIIASLDGSEVTDSISFVPDNEDIKVLDVKTGNYTDIYKTNSYLGDYKFMLLHGKNFKIFYDAPDHVFDTYNVYGEEAPTHQNLVYNAILHRITTGETEKYKETPFAENSADFNDFTKTELDLIADAMNQYPELVVNFSTEDYMKESDNLSETRKQKAVDYLLNKGIAKERIYVDLSPRDISDNTLEYTIFDTESVKTAVEDKKKRIEDNKIVVPTDYIVTIENVYFEFNKFEMRVSPNESLNKLAEYMKRNSSAKIEVVGYTDAVGSDSYNIKLSNKRAKTVEAYLKEQGVTAEQISFKAYGEKNPVALNKKDGAWFEESKQYNRRVEFRILEQGQPKLIIKQNTKVPEQYKDSKYDLNYNGR